MFDRNLDLYLSLAKEHKFNHDDKDVFFWFAIVEDHKNENEFDETYTGIAMYHPDKDEVELHWKDCHCPKYGFDFNIVHSTIRELAESDMDCKSVKMT